MYKRKSPFPAQQPTSWIWRSVLALLTRLGPSKFPKSDDGCTLDPHPSDLRELYRHITDGHPWEATFISYQGYQERVS